MLKKVSSAALALLALAAAAAAYTDLSLLVRAEIQPDGSALVGEEVRVALNNQQELESFDYYATLGDVPLTEWKRFSDRVSYHFNGPILKTSIQASRDYTTGISVGRILVEYLVNTTLVRSAHTGPRTTTHTLTNEYFGFERGGGGASVLPTRATLTLVLPAGAVLKKAVPEPSERRGGELSWTGPLAANWLVEYEVEKPLTEEVSEYFEGLYRSLLSPSQLPVTLLALALLAGGALYLWGRRGKRAA